MQKRIMRWLFGGIILGFLFGCGSTEFGGSAPVAPQTETETELTGDIETEDDELGTSEETSNEDIKFDGINLTKEEKAINRCLDQWQDHDLTAKDVKNYHKIPAAVSILGNSKAIVDDQVTDKPRLLLITAGVNVLGSPEYDFLNPNGYYCIMVGVNVQTNLTINAHCKARLAENKVNVNVLSESRPTASIGVDVLSNVKVNRVGNDCDG